MNSTITQHGIWQLVKSLAQLDPRIRTVHYYDALTVDPKAIELPALVFKYGRVELDGSVVRATFHLMGFDRVLPDRSNVAHIPSTLTTILQDHHNQITRNVESWEHGIIAHGTPIIEAAPEDEESTVKAQLLTFTLQLPDTACLTSLGFGPIDLTGDGYAYSGNSSSEFGCADLQGCSLIQSIQADIAELFTLTGSTGSSSVGTLQQVTDSGNTTTNNIILANTFDDLADERKIIFRELGSDGSSDFTVGQSAALSFGAYGELVHKAGGIMHVSGLPLFPDSPSLSGSGGIHQFTNTTNSAAKLGIDFYSDLSSTTYGAGQSFFSSLSGNAFTTTLVNDQANPGHALVSLPSRSGILALRSDLTPLLPLSGGTVGPTTFTGSTTLESVKASFILSGGTDLSNLIPQATHVQGGTNTFTGGTPSKPTVNVTSTPTFTSVSATSISATTLVESGIPISSLYAVNPYRTFLNYTGGTQTTTSVTLSSVHPTAKLNIPEAGFYYFHFIGRYSANAVTTGAWFSVSGSASQDFFSANVDCTTAVGDRGNNQMDIYGGGSILSSSLFTTSNTITVTGYINATSTGDLFLMQATELAGTTSISTTTLKGFIERR